MENISPCTSRAQEYLLSEVCKQCQCTQTVQYYEVSTVIFPTSLLTLFLSRGKIHCMTQWESSEILLKSKARKRKALTKEKRENNHCSRINPRLVTSICTCMNVMGMWGPPPCSCHTAINQAVLSSEGQSRNQQNWRRVCNMFTGHSKNTFIYQEMRIELCCVFDKKLLFLCRSWSFANISSKCIFLLGCRNCHWSKTTYLKCNTPSASSGPASQNMHLENWLFT